MTDKIKYLIVEDEEKSRITLLKKIQMCELDEIICTGMATNAREALLLAKNTAPDFVLLDINLPDQNGFDLLDELKTINPKLEVIFTSAHTENDILLNALKKSPINYLIKPIDIDELSDAINIVCIKIKIIKNGSQTNLKKKLHFSGFNGSIFIMPNDIFAIKADGHYSNLLQVNGTTNMLNQSLANIEKQMELPSENFLRADRSTILNLMLITELKSKDKTCLLRKEDKETTLKLSESGYKNVLKALKKD